jgi:hypothetical protein
MGAIRLSHRAHGRSYKSVGTGWGMTGPRHSRMSLASPENVSSRISPAPLP